MSEFIFCDGANDIFGRFVSVLAFFMPLPTSEKLKFNLKFCSESLACLVDIGVLKFVCFIALPKPAICPVVKFSSSAPVSVASILFPPEAEFILLYFHRAAVTASPDL